MIDIKPFKAIIPASDFIKDFLNSEAGIVNSYTNLYLSQKEHSATENLIHKGVLEWLSTSSYYLYQQKNKEFTHLGILALCSAKDYQEKRIKKHENIQQYRVDGLKSFFTKQGINADPVLQFYRNEENFETALLNAFNASIPIISFTDQQNIEHTICQTDEACSYLIDLFFKELDFLYIADGHHRCATLGNYHQDDTILSYIVSDKNLSIYGYYRELICDTTEEANALIDLLVQNFNAFVVDESTKVNRGEILVKHTNITLKIEIDEYKNNNNIVESLDAFVLDEIIIKKLIENKPIGIAYLNGNLSEQELKEKIKNHPNQIFFIITPVDAEDIISVADQQEIMPAKSTFIVPKIPSGLIFHKL